MKTKPIAKIGINEDGSTAILILDASIPPKEYEERFLEAVHGMIENRIKTLYKKGNNKPKIVTASGAAINKVDKTRIN